MSNLLNCVFQADGEELLTLAKEVNSAQAGSAKVEQLDDALIKQLSYVSAGDLAPVNAFIGGLAAQEVMKVSGVICSSDSPVMHLFLVISVDLLLSD